MVESAALLTNRGVIHQFIGDLVNAIRDYQKAVSVQPDYSLAHFNIGNVLFQQRHFKQVRYSSYVYKMYARVQFNHSNDTQNFKRFEVPYGDNYYPQVHFCCNFGIKHLLRVLNFAICTRKRYRVDNF